MYYFLDNVLQVYQQFEYSRMHEDMARGDVAASYRRQADARLSDEVTKHVQSERDWRAWCMLVGPWRELEPMLDARRFRRTVYVYEVAQAANVRHVSMPITPLWRWTADKPNDVKIVELRARPVRGVADNRTLLGVVYEDTLLISEIRA